MRAEGPANMNREYNAALIRGLLSETNMRTCELLMRFNRKRERCSDLDACRCECDRVNAVSSKRVNPHAKLGKSSAVKKF